MDYKKNFALKKKDRKIDIGQLFKERANILLIIIIIIQICTLVHYGRMKKGYYVDEVWSYGLANSYYHPHVYWNDALSEWVSGDYFKEYLEVSEAERFKYGSVIFNQKNDVHPPLFYAILHTICSFFPNTFSKWYVIVPNLFCFFICMVLLYKIGKVLFDNSYLALMPVIAYGLCSGSISNVMFLRMYALLNVWILYSFYLHSKWIKSEYVDLKGFFKLMIITYLGFMSHYYYFIFAFFLAVCYIFFLFWKKQIMQIVSYCLAMAGSFVLVLLTFPTAFAHLLFGYRGREAFENLLKVNNFFAALKRFYEIMIEDTLANCGFFLWIGIIGGIILLIKKYFLEKEEKSAGFYIVLTGIVIISAYMAVVAKIAPFHVDRYIFCIYPLVSLILTYLFYFILREFSIPPVWGQVFITVLFVMLTIKGIYENRIHYLYPEAEKNIELMEEHSGDDCIYITNEYYKLTGNALELENMGRVLALMPENMEDLSNILDESVDEMIVYVDEWYNQDEIMKLFCDAGKFRTYRLLFVSGCYAYVVER